MEADEKECPFCAEIIKAKAKVCKHCGRELAMDNDKIDDKTKRDTSPQKSKEKEAGSKHKVKNAALGCVGIVVIAIIGLAVIGSFLEGEKASPATSESSQNQAEEINQNLISDSISAETLAKAFSENKSAAENEYKDKALLVIGEVKNATPGVFSGAYFVMTTDAGEVQFDFPDDKSIEPLRDVYIGDIVQISGKFDRVSEKYIEISDASFDRVTTPSPSRGKLAVIDATKQVKIDYRNDILSKTISGLSSFPSLQDCAERFDVISSDESSTDVNTFHFRIIYKDSQSDMKRIEVDCRAVVKSCLDALVADGRKPASEWISVSSTGWYPHKGVTGEDLIATYGRASYNYNNDSIRFEQEK